MELLILFDEAQIRHHAFRLLVFRFHMFAGVGGVLVYRHTLIAFSAPAKFITRRNLAHYLFPVCDLHGRDAFGREYRTPGFAFERRIRAHHENN